MKSNKKYYHYVKQGAIGRLKGAYISVFENGYVYGSNWKILVRNFSGYKRKLGKWVDLIPLEQDSFNEILHPSRQVYSYNGKGRRARSYKVRSFIRNQLPAKYKSLYSTARGAQTQYIDINEPNPRNKITVGKEARQLKLPVSQTKEDFFHSLITEEQEEFLNKTFGSWRHFFKSVNNPYNWNFNQMKLDSFFEEENSLSSLLTKAKI